MQKIKSFIQKKPVKQKTQHEQITTPSSPEGGASPPLIIGPGVQVEGLAGAGMTEFRCEGMVSNGNVRAETAVIVKAYQGDLTCSDLELHYGATLSGSVVSANAVIAGTCTGELTCLEKLTLLSTAKVSGRVRYQELIRHRGASIEGDHRVTPVGDNTPPRRRYGKKNAALEAQLAEAEEEMSKAVQGVLKGKKRSSARKLFEKEAAQRETPEKVQPPLEPQPETQTKLSEAYGEADEVAARSATHLAAVAEIEALANANAALRQLETAAAIREQATAEVKPNPALAVLFDEAKEQAALEAIPDEPALAAMPGTPEARLEAKVLARRAGSSSSPTEEATVRSAATTELFPADVEQAMLQMPKSDGPLTLASGGSTPFGGLKFLSPGGESVEREETATSAVSDECDDFWAKFGRVELEESIEPEHGFEGDLGMSEAEDGTGDEAEDDDEDDDEDNEVSEAKAEAEAEAEVEKVSETKAEAEVEKVSETKEAEKVSGAEAEDEAAEQASSIAAQTQPQAEADALGDKENVPAAATRPSIDALLHATGDRVEAGIGGKRPSVMDIVKQAEKKKRESQKGTKLTVLEEAGAGGRPQGAASSNKSTKKTHEAQGIRNLSQRVNSQSTAEVPKPLPKPLPEPDEPVNAVQEEAIRPERMRISMNQPEEAEAVTEPPTPNSSSQVWVKADMKAQEAAAATRQLGSALGEAWARVQQEIKKEARSKGEAAAEAAAALAQAQKHAQDMSKQKAKAEKVLAEMTTTVKIAQLRAQQAGVSTLEAAREIAQS